ncbi:tubulin monoglutamylase TTLL4-like [Babylonia areolata]|uniref:tubulin monoglutamylase TTLL4-like n=1 Tax=Babylonia areolata TaxID=304850 RepID=UPI003FD30D8F
MSVVSPCSDMRKNHRENTSDSGVQFSSFLQPHNGVQYDCISSKITPQKREHSTLSQSASELNEPYGQGKGRGQYNPDKSPGYKIGAGFGGPSDAFGPGLPPRPKDLCAKERRPANGYLATSSSHTDIAIPLGNDGDGDSSSGHFVQSSENIGCNKKLRSDMTGRVTKPLSVSASFNSAHSRPETMKVHHGRSVSNSQVEPMPVLGDISSMAGVEESGLPLHNLTASSLLNTRMGMLRKMPTAKPLSGAVHYKKNLLEASTQGSKKAVPVMLEHRPHGDGAPSKRMGVLGDEKSLTATTSVNGPEEEEEDDVSLPSGERLPGDGEASDIDELGDDDDGIDDINDDCQNDEVDDSDGYSVSSSMSHESSSTVHLPSATSRPSTTQSSCGRSTVPGEERSVSTTRPLTSSGEMVVQPALRRSLFATIPPTVNFAGLLDKVEELPWDIRKMLKWRMSPITPNVIKAVLRRNNFRITKRNDWMGCFGKHMKAAGFKAIREYQKLNHFPGSFQLGRKDRLWRNLSRMQVSFGKKEFGFFPRTYILPQDMKHLKRTWEDSNSRQKWIIKPPASARGLGIKVISKWSQIPRRRPVIVQKYLSKPLLINDSKFDMRVYVYVTSYDPLRAYIYEDGLARFASCKYSSAMKNLNNKFMHLTNYSINKHNVDYQTSTDDSGCQGHKWSLKSLWNYLEKEGMDTGRLWESIKDIVIKTLISADGPINTMIKANVRSRYTVHELFGFDILLDDQLRPWILEVNISPSLHSTSPLDISIKSQLVRDMLNLAGFRIPDKTDIVNTISPLVGTLPDLSTHIPTTDHCIDKRLFTNQLSADERAKHAYFCHKNQDEQVLQGILDTLTPDDVRILTESVDEESRKGGFIRVFPTPNTKKYLRYFEQPRYYNLLLDQWVTRYHRMEQRGISVLQSACEDGIHLENPTSNIHHQWCPPNSSGALLSARDKNPSPLKKDAYGQKGSVSTTRLPKVKSGVGDAHISSSSFPGGSSSSFSALNSSSPVSRPARVLDPTR